MQLDEYHQGLEARILIRAGYEYKDNEKLNLSSRNDPLIH
jgi:hypothetical protein